MSTKYIMIYPVKDKAGTAKKLKENFPTTGQIEHLLLSQRIEELQYIGISLKHETVCGFYGKITFNEISRVAKIVRSMEELIVCYVEYKLNNVD